jgi:hypothetical protein
VIFANPPIRAWRYEKTGSLTEDVDMRFEVSAAFVIGVLLPVLETCRRGLGHWLVDATTMLEDYVAGLLLLFAATMAMRGRHNAYLWLVLAWSAVTGMMSMSFLDQVESTLRGGELEPRNGLVLGVKFLLWGTCMLGLVFSFRRASVSNVGADR